MTWLWVLVSVALCASLFFTAHVRRGHRRPRVDWARVTELEQEIFGEDFDHAGEPGIPPAHPGVHNALREYQNRLAPISNKNEPASPPRWDVELAQLDYRERREYFGGVRVYVHDAMHQRSRLTVTGGGARVEIGGTVADGARVSVIGDGATITVNGRIDAGAQVTAAGAGARVIAHGPVHWSARVTPRLGR